MTVEDPGYVPIDEPLDDGSTSRTPGRPVEQFVAIRTVMGALRRRRRLWVITAIIGLVLGLAVTVVITPKYTATSSLLLFHNPADDQTLDMANDAAIADTATVAQDVVNRLRLSLTANQLLSDCQVVVVSDALLQVSVSAATPSAALLRTSTLAAVFLNVRTQLYEAQNHSTVAILEQTEASLDATVQSLYLRIAQAASGSSTAPLQNELSQYQQQAASIQSTITADNSVTSSIVSGSHTLGTATLNKHSAAKRVAVDGGFGLIGGLVVGLGFVALQTVVSDRLRRRDEIASALEASVRLSIDGFHSPRWMRLWRLRRRLTHPGKPVNRLARHLRALLGDAHGPRGLAVVAVDSIDPAALAICGAVRTLAVENKHVTVVDLSPERLLGRLFGLKEAGAHEVPFDGADEPVLVIVPSDDDAIDEAIPEPLPTRRHAGTSSGSDTTVVLLELRPGDRLDLAEWASEAVVVVTAGRSSATRLRGVAEMLRGAELPIASVVLVGADHNDGTLGTFEAPA